MSSAWLSLATFLTLTAITPGPNNLIVMLAASRRGFVTALPAIAGVLSGSLVLLVLVWNGLGVALEAFPMLRFGLTLAASAYLVGLGLLLALVPGRHDPERMDVALPGTVWGVALFQFLNPKGWILVTTATAIASRDVPGLPPFGVAALLLAITSACLMLWAVAGATLSQWMEHPTNRRLGDRVMGVLLALLGAMLIVGV